MTISYKSAIITGATHGLGKAIAHALHAQNITVHCIARDAEMGAQTIKEIGENAHFHKADIADYSALAKIAENIPYADILINNAGVWLSGALSENSPEEIERTIKTNLTGLIFATKAFLPLLMKEKQAHIVNIASTSGLKGRDKESVYVATKYGVTGFTESLRLDLQKSPIKVSGFFPGGMDTDLYSSAGKPKDTTGWMAPSAVAELITTILSTDDSMNIDQMVIQKRLKRTE